MRVLPLEVVFGLEVVIGIPKESQAVRVVKGVPLGVMDQGFHLYSVRGDGEIDSSFSCASIGLLDGVE